MTVCEFVEDRLGLIEHLLNHEGLPNTKLRFDRVGCFWIAVDRCRELVASQIESP